MELSPTLQLLNILDPNKVIDEQTAVHLLENFIQAGADIHVKDEEDNNLLHLAAHRNHPLIIDYLVGKKVDLQAFNKQNLTPLHIAAEQNKLKALHRLIAARLPLDNTNYRAQLYDFTPLKAALIATQVNAAAILINAGANLYSNMPNGRAPIQFITQQVARDLILAGAHHNNLIEKIEATYPYLIQAILKGYIVRILPNQINAQDNNNTTLLMYAAANQRNEIVKFLVNKNAFLFLQDKQNRTVFDILQNIFSMQWELASYIPCNLHKIYQKIAKLCGKKALLFLLLLEKKRLAQKSPVIVHDVWLYIAFLILGKETFDLSKQPQKVIKG
jgi:ankyrin repeat protein